MSLRVIGAGLGRTGTHSLKLALERLLDDGWASADRTIFAVSRREPPRDPVFSAQRVLATTILNERFRHGWSDEKIAKQAYQRHNDEVRKQVARDRLLEWQPGDGWEPICAQLGLAVPSETFPHVNTTGEFRAMAGLGSPLTSAAIRE